MLFKVRVVLLINAFVEANEDAISQNEKPALRLLSSRVRLFYLYKVHFDWD